MAKTGAADNKRDGAVKKRSQVENPVTGLWAKRDADSGQIMDVKTTGGKFKGVRSASGKKRATKKKAASRKKAGSKTAKRAKSGKRRAKKA